MVIPGMYFLVKCDNENCVYYLKTLPTYIGSNGKFDMFHSFKLIRCSGCCLGIKNVPTILFAACVWGYRGQIKGEKKITTETDKRVHRIEIFDQGKECSWDWLVIHVKPLQQHLELETIEIGEGNNFSKVIEDMIIQFALTDQASKYYKKYEKIKKLLDFPLKRPQKD